MKKMESCPVFSVKRFAVHDGDGIRTTAFLMGCPLRCVWCHNPEGLTATPKLGFYAHKCKNCGTCAAVCPNGAHVMTAEGIHRFEREKCALCGACVSACPASAVERYGNVMTSAELIPLLTEDRLFYEASGGGVTLSGGECLTHPAFCREVLEGVKAEGIATAVDTCGCVPRSAIEAVLPFTDIFLYDIKAMDPAVHEKCTGRDNRLILENLRFLADSGAKFEIRYPFVPGFNDGEAGKIAEFLSGFVGENSPLTAVRVLPYHNMAKAKYSAVGLPPDLSDDLPTEETLAAARAEFTSRGIRVRV